MNSTAISREDLYQKVWSIPASKLASELRVSDVMIGRHCREMDIPKPPPGYWARVYAGQKPSIPPLPKASNTTVSALYYTPSESCEPEFIRDGEDQLIPPYFLESIEDPHGLVTAVKSYIGESDDPTLPKGEGFIDINVSDGQLDRALRIADALFKSFEANGLSIDVWNSQYWGERTRIMREGCCVYLSISERYQKEKREPKPGEKRKPPYLVVEPETCVATGKLSVKVTHGYSDYKLWNDRQNDPLQYRLGEILIYITRIIEGEVEKKDAEEEEKRLRIEAKERADREKKCREELLKDANDWEQADKLRRYLKALAATVRSDDPEHAVTVDEYLCWATNFVDEIDPLTQINIVREQQDGEEED